MRTYQINERPREVFKSLLFGPSFYELFDLTQECIQRLIEKRQKFSRAEPIVDKCKRYNMFLEASLTALTSVVTTIISE